VFRVAVSGFPAAAAFFSGDSLVAQKTRNCSKKVHDLFYFRQSSPITPWRSARSAARFGDSRRRPGMRACTWLPRHL